MLATSDIMGLGVIANHIREKINGRRVFYGVNMNLNYTNICELRCPICAFSKDAGDDGAYTYTLDDVEERVRNAAAQGLDEVHIVGGLNPELKIDYFEEMLRRIKSVDSRIHIVAFTAVEYDYFAKLNNISLYEVFDRLKNAGLGSIPGGGAEIFADDKRTQLAPKKIPADRWLAVMERAHGRGIKTNATMLYNHVEDIPDIVDHLNRVRELQNRTGGFKTFVPLLFHPGPTGIVPSGRFNSGFGDIRIYAAARIFLHNVPHIKALWMYLGEKMAQIMLSFGADDIGATYINEKVVHSAGAKTPDFGREEDLVHLIENAGFQPVRTSADYSGDRP
jgi:aminodeoxyfutalosine synthase